MKRIILSICLACVSAIAFAQNSSTSNPTTTVANSVSVGIVGGVNFSYLDTKSSSGYKFSNKYIEPFSLGVNVDFKINSEFSIRPALIYSGKGGEVSYNEVFFTPAGTSGDVTVKQDIKLNYLEIPVDFIGHFPVNGNLNVLVGIGPYIAYGLNGKTTSTQNGANPESTNLTFGSNNDVKRFDYGATGMLGVEIKRVSIGLNYDVGLPNVVESNNNIPQPSLKTGAFYLSVGYAF